MNIGTLTISLGCDATGLIAANTAMNTFAANATKSINAVSQRFRTFGYLASMALTAPIVMLGKNTIQMGMDFEFTLKKMIGLAGVAKGSLGQISTEIKNLAVSTGISAQNVAEAYYYVASSGIKGANVLAVTEMAAKGAASGMGEVNDLAKLLTSAMNAYASSGLDVTTMMDTLTATIRVGKAEPAEMVNALGTILPIAQKLGLDIQDVGGALATMTLITNSTATSATYLRNVLMKLLDPTPQVRDAMKSMGISMEQIHTLLKTPNGFIKTMELLGVTTEKYGVTMDAIFPEMRSLLGALNFTGEGLKRLKANTDDVNNSMGSFQAHFAEMSMTIKMRWNKALAEGKNAMIDLGMSIAKGVLPILESLIKKLGEITKWFDSLTDVQKKHKLEWLAFIAILGPASLLISLIGYSLSGLITVLGGTLSVLKFLASDLIITTVAGNASTISMGALTISFENLGAAALTAGAAIGKFVLGGLLIGTVVTAAWPLIQKLIDKIKDLKSQIAEAKAVLNYSDAGMQLDDTIARNMSVLNKLDQQQLQDTKAMIGQRIALEREKLINAETTGKKEIENEKFVLDKKKEIAEQEQLWQHRLEEYNRGVVVKSDLDTWGGNISLNIQKANNAINSYIKNRQNEVEYDKLAAEDTIGFYEKQGKVVDNLITKQTTLGNTVTASGKEQREALERLTVMWKQFYDARALIKDIAKPDLSNNAVSESAWSIWKQNKETKGGGLYQGDWAAEASAIAEYNNKLLNQGQVLNGLAKSFEEFFQNIGGGFKGMVDSMLNQLKMLFAKMIGLFILKTLLTALDPMGLGVMATTMWRKFIGAKGYANGTNYSMGGTALVGERGPELVNLPRGSQVLPNNMLGAAARSQTVVIKLDGDIVAKGRDLALVLRRAMQYN